MAANGIGVPVKMALSGSGITAVAGPVYQVTLSLTGTTTVTVTPAVTDIAGSDPTYTGAYNWVSYNGAPTGTAGRVASVASATGATMVVTARSLGMAIIECFVPAFDVDGANLTGSGKIYALLQVTVTA
jgi:hypothetical protein